MKKISVGLMMMMMVMAFSSQLSAAGSSAARDLEIAKLKEDVAVLKEQAGKKSEGNSGYDKGFFVVSKDGNFKLTTSLYGQMYYEYRNNYRTHATNTFGLRRARLGMQGYVFDPKWRYRMESELVTTYYTTPNTYESNARLLNMYGEYGFSEALNIRFGEFKSNLFRQYTTDVNKQQFVNFPIVVNTEPFSPNYHTGVSIWGAPFKKKFHYELFAVNPTLLDRTNSNRSFRLGTRLSFDVLGSDIKYADGDLEYSDSPQLAFGGHFSYERVASTVANSYTNGDDIFRASLDALFKYKGFSFDPEGMIFYNKKQHIRHYAMATQIGYFVIPKKMDIAGQASCLWFDGANNNQYEFGGGLNYYFHGQNVKLQADYNLLWNQNAAGAQKSHRVRMQMQVGFF